jgi:simple sugar transport system substrate-binding protein
MSRTVLLLIAALLAAVAAGCGGTTTVRESPVTVRETPTRAASPERDAPAPAAPGSEGVRIAVVTHGQASSAFWTIVRNGVEAAARQMDVVVNYRAPDVYSLDQMIALVDRAVASHPDGLVVSLPEPGLAPAIRRAVRAGIPVVTINSGSDSYKKLGVLAHIGQPEDRAGLGAGRRLAALGVHRALCVNLKIVNQGLDARCRGLRQAMHEVGGTVHMIRLDDQAADAPEQIARAVDESDADGVLALNSNSGLAAAKGLAGRTNVKIGTFDLGPDILRAVQGGSIAFAVDQQAYLQGYLPVVLLAERARYGLFPAQGDVIPTGPNFVTRANAAQVIQLSERAIR